MLQQVVLVGAVAALVMFANLGGARLWDRDEPRNAGCAAEMLTRHDWVTPVFNAELRTHKPVLLYWLIMSAYSLFGVNEFAARLWSAVLAVGTTGCTYAIGRRLFSPAAGVWAGVILGSTLMFDLAGRAATPDSALVFFSTLAMTIYVLAAFPVDGKAGTVETGHDFFPPWPYAAAMYATMGLAVLAKGPVGFVLPTAVIGLFQLIMRLPNHPPRVASPPTAPPKVPPRPNHWQRWASLARVADPWHFLRTCWALRPFTAVAACLVVALPWYVWVGLRTEGQFLRGFFLEHNVSRAVQSMEGHQGSLLFYPAAILVGFFPWSIFAIPVGLDAWRHARENARLRPAYVFAASWVAVWVGLFSLAQTKLPNYVTPCYPALAILTGCFLERWLRQLSHVGQNWLRASFGSAVLVGLILTGALPLLADRYLPGDEWLGAIGLVPVAGGLMALVWAERQNRQRASLCYAVSAVAFVTLLFGGVASRVDRHQQNHVLLESIAANSSEASPRVASLGLLEPTWIFYGGRPVIELSEPGVGSPNPSWIERDGHWVSQPPPAVETLLKDDDPLFIITSDRYLEALSAKLPRDFQVLAECPRFLRKGKLLLVGRPKSALVAGQQPDTAHR